MSVEQIKTPDIGGESGEIIEILVAVGDQVEAEQSLVVLESAKASMEVPSPVAGKITKLHVSTGDSLEEGMPILDMEVADNTTEQPQDAPSDEVDEDKDKEKELAKAEGETKVEQKPSSSSAQETSRLVKVPGIGSDKAEIIELSVKVGDLVSDGDTLVVAESEKASMDIPSDLEGRVEAIHVKVGDQISEGQGLVTLMASEVDNKESEAAATDVDSAPSEENAETPAVRRSTGAAESKETRQQVPDLGSESAEVIEVSVKVGDRVAEGDTLVVAESDKASLEIPAEVDGEIVAIHCAVGDKISQGADLATIKTTGTVEEAPEEPAEKQAIGKEQPVSKPEPKNKETETPEQKTPSTSSGGNVYAGPAVRKLAREFGIDLASVKASGPRGRTLKEDLQQFVKDRLKAAPAAAGGLPSVANVDWAKFGTVRTEATSKIHRLTAENMLRSWLNVPHVTQFDDADVTELEEYRAMIKHEGTARGIKMTPLAFILKASCKALKNNPKFNAALSNDAMSLVFREYFHIGIAVDTPAGLMVPVVRDVDQKDIWQLASEIAELADKAKNSKLKPNEMQGACFTVSSLGAIGGRGFTPIVPSPQVGILGVSKTAVQPVWDGEVFQPRKLMPLALSYDHRAVNGADAGRFLTYLVEQLGAVENIWSD